MFASEEAQTAEDKYQKSRFKDVKTLTKEHITLAIKRTKKIKKESV